MLGWLRGGGHVHYEVPRRENPAPHPQSPAEASGDLVLILEMRTRQLRDAVRDVDNARQEAANTQLTLLSVRAELTRVREQLARAVMTAGLAQRSRDTLRDLYRSAQRANSELTDHLERVSSWQVANADYGLRCGLCGGPIVRGQAVKPQPGTTKGAWNHCACPEKTQGEN
jgi:hypothetical protein